MGIRLIYTATSMRRFGLGDRTQKHLKFDKKLFLQIVLRRLFPTTVYHNMKVVLESTLIS
jgi:hypothetical protein